MNILYIFGNGFDKAMGLATSYPEFYTYLKYNVKNGSPLFNKMISQITSDTTLWSDMELALGKFTEITTDDNEFDEFYFELNEHLQQYLTRENDKFIPIKELKSKFLVDFTKFERYLAPLDKGRFNNILNELSLSSTKDTSVINFNYTNTLEKLLEVENNLVAKYLGNNTSLVDIILVHGILGQSIIVGVDNESQIKNIDFKKIEDLKDCLVKMQSNNVMKETRHLRCSKLIERTNLIILFGVSLGDTDSCWWEKIGKNFVKRKDLLIIQHIYNPDVVYPTQMQKRGRYERKQQDFILDKMKVNEESRTPELRDRLFFTINEPIFKV